MKPKISVIIPTYNAEKFLFDAFNSVLNQTIGFKNIELIFVDDNSQDSTKDILKDLSEKYENVKVIFLKDNSGSPSKPRNIGIEASTADYIMFLDNDDSYKKNICEKLYSTAVKFDADIVNCRIYFSTNEENLKEKNVLDKKENIQVINSLDEDSSILVSTSIWNKIYKRSFIIENSIKFAIDELYEDTFFNIQAFINASKIISLNNYYGFYYNIRESEDDFSTSKNFNKKNLRKMYKGFKNIKKYLKTYDKTYSEFENQCLMGITKWILLSDCEKEYKIKIYKEFKKYFKEFSLFFRYENVSFIKGLLMNFFMKFISLNDNIFKLIVYLMDKDWFRHKLQNFHFLTL